jgi:hypothetical protein
MNVCTFRFNVEVCIRLGSLDFSIRCFGVLFLWEGGGANGMVRFVWRSEQNLLSPNFIFRKQNRAPIKYRALATSTETEYRRVADMNLLIHVVT